MKPGASTPARQDAAFAHITPFAALACLVTAGVTLWHLLHPGRSMMRPRS